MPYIVHKIPNPNFNKRIYFSLHTKPQFIPKKLHH